MVGAKEDESYVREMIITRLVLSELHADTHTVAFVA